MSEFKQYRKKALCEARPYVEGEVLPIDVSISKEDAFNGSPRVGDMIARNPEDHLDMWLIAKKFFDSSYVLHE